MKIIKTEHPQASILQKAEDFQFADGYSAYFSDPKNEINIEQAGRLFFLSAPRWIDQLFYKKQNCQTFRTKNAGQYRGKRTTT